MKKLLLLLLILAGVNAYSQKIKEDAVDKFTKKRVIETSIVPIRPTLSSPLSASIRSNGSSVFLTLWGSNSGATVIGTDDPAVFLFENDSTMKLFPTHIQSYEISSVSGNSFKHQYFVNIEELSRLKSNKVKSIRKYGTEYYTDFDIPGKNQGKLSELADLFLKTFNKN